MGATAVPAAGAPLPASFVNGRYKVLGFLGEGGKKTVYLAHDTQLDRDVAFSLIKTEGLDEAGRERVQREAQALGKLGSHPNIVSVFDLREEPGSDAKGRPSEPSPGKPFIVTEYLAGGDLEHLIADAPDHRLPLARVLELGGGVSNGLAFAHDHGIVHRDLKPGNVLLTAGGVRERSIAAMTSRAIIVLSTIVYATPSWSSPVAWPFNSDRREDRF